MNPEMSQKYEQYVIEIENYLAENCFLHDSEPQKTLFSAMRYSLLAGGKRLRPLLVLEFCRICGGDWKAALPLAAAIEMIHTYSLIHDDLPCMDNDDYRRGKPTNHKVFGEAIAVLAGDGLLTAAFGYISKADLCAEARISAVEVLADCAGEIGMVGGQVLDIQSEERLCTEQEVLDIQLRKTGALIRAACIMGVIAAGGDKSKQGAAGEFASRLGLAFQIRDDMLDVIGNSEELGKAVGADKNKNTFVRLYGIERCDELVQQHTAAAIKALEIFADTEFLMEMAMQLTSRTI